MVTLLASLIGFLAIVIAAAWTATMTWKIETRKETGRLAAAAFVDMLQAFAENSEAVAVLHGSSADPLLQEVSEAERSRFLQQLERSRIGMISAKARLITFGSSEVAVATHDALSRDPLTGADPGLQRAMCELVQSIREDLYPRQGRLDDHLIIEMLFGGDAEALFGVIDDPH
jgi:hypothetical protein